ncbi:hypothetical protein KC19_2G034600 [Ceratodon purpureus]|uniref:CHHC U11-48K-type domain-containing protein n=1 Tax=Ceratodon purpureus TaxID=3225 RepID=A0A8T0IRF5_CERPU|nr:hypothetical protein KC19_2G034600 [Ceratodon purpureus]
MANRPHFGGWGGYQGGPGAGVYGEPFGGEFRPGVAFPGPSAPVFRQFPPPVAYRGLYPGPGAGSPGFSGGFQGWSPYPGGYVASPGAMSPGVMSLQSQGYGAHGNSGAGGFVSQVQVQRVVELQPGVYGGAVGDYGGVPRSSDSRPGSGGKPLFLSWIDEIGKDSASLEISGESRSVLRDSDDKSGVVKSSELYRLVDRVEDAVAKILGVADMENLGSGTEWGVCPFNPRHVVPTEALLRHTLQCRSSSGSAVEASSLLEFLQYPHTVDLNGMEPSTHDERVTDRRLGAEYSSNNATLSFENAALLSVGRTSSKRLDLGFIKQESGCVESGDLSEKPRVKAKVKTNNMAEKLDCGTLTLHTTRQQFDPKGSLFFYGDAPGVVLTSLAHYSSKSYGDAMSSMPHFLRVELEKCPSVTLESVGNEEGKNGSIVLSYRATEDRGAENRYLEEDGKEIACVGILPSMLWDLGEELKTWKDMPSQCSRTVLQAATCLGRVRKALIVEWLLAHSPAYGVVLDVAMAAHISCLVQLYVKALRTQSLLLFDQTFGRGLSKRDTSISVDSTECPIYVEASTWLASWLSHLYGPIKSKLVVLDILKHCLNLCGRFLSVIPLDLNSQQGGCKNGGKIKGATDDESNVFMEPSKMLPKRPAHASEDILGVEQVGAAIDAICERANFERYITSSMSVNNATNPQRITSYDMTVMSANNERAKRRNYHAVCEHDGLTWQRSQQEEKRNKTKAELLAEERDYKRRRMSYRGKKLKRTPLQVLHDIIENHMAEITDAGGIGCFSKQPSRTDLEIQPQVPEGILSQPHFQQHSGSTHDSKMSSIEMAGKAPRLYDDHRETSSSVKNEFRPKSERRYDDERHHSYRR